MRALRTQTAGAAAPGRSSGEDGALALLLHTHMPYVLGFGTWPFGEEWLWEAIATCYLPLLELLDEGTPLTVSLTPVLCDQLEAPAVAERFASFVRDVRRATHDEDAAGLRAGGHELLARELERAGRDYELALERFDARSGDLLGSFARHAQWTSSATHAVLPLLASDAGVELQVRSGIAAHRRRFGEGTPKGTGWRGGFWLPECAHADWLEGTLARAGVRSVCVELTGRLGLGAREHLRPIASGEGIMLVPVDRATMSLVWSERGYPADGAYRDYHHHTVHHHNPWSNDGSAYDPARAQERVLGHAADFVARTRERLRDAGSLPGGGLVVCALDTELLGHWWYEGIAWLRAVVEECARQGLELVRLDDALERVEPAAGEAGPASPWASSWGQGGDLSTWSGPRVTEMAFAMRRAELDVHCARERAGAVAVRELLALQASDWPFMVTRGLAGPYPRERFDAHERALARALGGETPGDASTLGNLAVDADLSYLLGA